MLFLILKIQHFIKWPETFGLELFFPHQDYKYFCFCNNDQFNIVRKHIGPWWVLLVQNHLLNSMTIFMKILHGYSAVLLPVCALFLQPLIHYNNETDENSIQSWT